MILTGKKIYLCKPNLEPITVLNGIKIDTVNYDEQVKDYDKLEFDVDEYIVIDGKQVKSNGYDDLEVYLYLYLEDIGNFQMQHPTVKNDGVKESKSIIAYSIEKEFADKNWVGLKVNTGDEDSLEQLVENNLNELGYAKSFIEFFKPQKQQLSFLHIMLKEKMPGWSVLEEDIDPLLWNKKFSLEEDNINLYHLLTSIIAPKIECVFLFDTIHRRIKAISKYNINYDTNIFIGFRNLANSVDITVNEDSVFTRFNCEGNDGLTLNNCNYNDSYIFDLSYFMRHPYMSQELVEKVQKWVDWRDDHRDEFINLSKSLADKEEKISEIKNRVPNDGDNWKQWDDMDEELLNKNLDYYSALLTALQVSVDPNPIYEDEENKEGYIPWIDENGEINHNKYLSLLYELANGYGGYYTYYEVLNYIIPNIRIAIENLTLTIDNKKEYITDFETNWELYGINELTAKKKSYEDKLNILSDFSKSWSNMTDEEKAKYPNGEEQYNSSGRNQYIEILGYLGTESTPGSLLYYLKILSEELETLNAEYDNINHERNKYVEQAKITDPSYGFTEQEIVVVNILFHDTDYQNTNILTTSVDTTITTIDREKELFEDSSSKLSEVSQPQFNFNVNMDNPLWLNEFESLKDDYRLLRYIRLGIRDDYSVKLRIIRRSWNPCEINSNFTIEFSNMITSRSGRSDLTDLLQSENNRGSKNSISIGTGNSKTEEEWRTNLLQLLISSQLFRNSVGDIASGSVSTNIDSTYIQSLVSQYIKTGKIDVGQITGDEASFKKFFGDYIDTDYLVSNSSVIKDLSTDTANIKKAIMGSTSTETGIVINLNSKNAKIDSAWIASLVSKEITVADLKAHTSTSEMIVLISSESGKPTIAFKDSTQQFYDSDGNVRVQIGQDNSGNFNFILKASDGTTTLFDADGIKKDAIADGLIVGNMIKDKAISTDKLDFNIETDEKGNVITSIHNVYTDGGGSFVDEYTSYKQSVEGDIKNINDKVDESIPYTLQVYSDSGSTFHRGHTSATLMVRLYHGNDDVTDSYPDSKFIWTRCSSDESGDTYWNQKHQEGSKTLTITKDDLYRGANFICTIIIQEDIVVTSN